MMRRILLPLIGCAALGVFACSQKPETPVTETEPAKPEPVLTAPDSTESSAQASESTSEASESPAVASETPAGTATTDGESVAAASTGEKPPAETPEGPGHPESGAETPLVSEAISSQAAPATVTPDEVVDVEPILDGVVAFYGGLQGFKVTAEVNRVISDEEGKPLTDEEGNPLPIPKFPPLVRELIVHRPNQFASRPEGGEMPAIVSNGEKIVTYFEETGKYMETPAPADFSDLSDTDVGRVLAAAGSIQMIPFRLMSADARKKLIDGATEIEYMGHENIEETPAHHLQFKGEQETPAGTQEMTWDMWVASDGDPLVLQTRLIQGVRTVQLPGAGPITMMISTVENLHDWGMNPELADNAFVATIPETAKPASDIIDLFQPPPPLLGEEAPEVKLPLLGDAGELDLAAHEGKDVVILDFWATWCGPCREGLPILSQVSEEYKDKGVVFYAVNLQETDDEIQTFLKDSGLPLTVAKDADGSAAGEFGVSGIPHSVVIGKNGIVQSVHIGFNPELGSRLRRELDAVLAGKDIYEGLPPETEATNPGETPESGDNAEPAASTKPDGESGQ